MTKKVKAKPTKANFIIYVALYRMDVMCSFGETDEEVKKSLQPGVKCGTITMEEVNKQFYEKKMAAYNFKFDAGPQLMRFPNIPSSAYEWGQLAHEIFHAACGIMDRVEIELCASSEEAFAYLIHFITAKIYEQLNKYL